MNAPRFTTADTERRDCSLYYIDTLDPATNYTTVRRDAYVGETAREPFLRFMEHLYEQPFGDIIVGGPRLDPRAFTSKAQVWAAEEEAIKRLKPIWNYEHNLDNPRRIPIPEARRQRATRDAARGVAPWQPPTEAQPRREPTRPSRRRSRRLSRTGRRAVWLSAGWLLVAGLAWWGAGRVPLTGWLRVEDSALAATVLLLAGWARTLPRRALRRQLVALIAFAGLGLLAWLTVPTLIHHLPKPVPALHQEHR